VVQTWRNRGGVKASLSGGTSSGAFNRGGFRRAARLAGLSEAELRFLEPYAKALGLANPDFVFKNHARLDSFFKDAYRIIEKNSESENLAEDEKASLFAIRERFTQRAATSRKITSTRQLGRTTPISFIVHGEESYPSIIVAVEPGGLAVEPARDSYNQIIRLRRGTRLSCYFYGSGRQGYQFETRIMGWEHIGAKEVMVLAHSEAVRALPARHHMRKEIKVPCNFFHIAVTQEKVLGKTKSHAKVEDLAFPGTIVDLSAGGIGIQTASPLPADTFLKIVFNPGNGTLAAFGKVVRMNPLRTMGGVMHIQFVKISRRSLNAILSHVYGYSEE
jgi:hypothetical protein